MKTVFNKELTDEELKDTKILLYRIRREKGYKAYQFFVRVLFIASYFSKLKQYISYQGVLWDVAVWVRSKSSSPLDFAHLGERTSPNSKYFGTHVDTLINGTWSEVYIETINKYNLELKAKEKW